MRYDLSWLQDEDVYDLIDALNCAVEFEGDKIEYADEYPDEYSDEDVAHMYRKRAAFNALFARITGSSASQTRDSGWGAGNRIEDDDNV